MFGVSLPFLSSKTLSRLFLTLIFPGNVGRLPVSVVYDEYQNAKAWKRRLSYTPPPRLARAAFSANGLSSTSSTSAEVMPNRDPLVYAHRRLIGEVFLLRSQVQDMMARRDLLVQQVKASARWELMKEWLESVWALESGRRVSASSVPIWRDQPSVRELLPGCNPEIRCRVAILGGAFFLNDSFLCFLTL